ncbi:MAG: MFS transporter [Coriobacteriia bacterium]|nr:MFS transporter [Coriobacteriia bacterium]
MSSNQKRISSAITVIILFGVISMLGDMVYESARGANSQYLNLIGISAAQVGLVFGIGEFIGYFLRLIAGVLSDRSGRHWLFIFVGYGLLIVVPLLGLTMNWPILIVLILTERIGKSLRNPAKDTVLSGVAEDQVGMGFAFGLQEALDQIGALAGPLVFTLVFYLVGKNGVAEYQTSYKALIVPYVLLMVFLTFVYRKFKRDRLDDDLAIKEYRSEKLPRIFWIYTLFTFFCTLGFVNFSVVGYHLKATNLLSDGRITLLYSAAMGIDAIAALAFGKAYDLRKQKTGVKSGGLTVLAVIPFLTLVIPMLTLGGSVALVIIGMLVFGIVMGTHEAIMRSAIADITPYYKRGTSFGMFNTSYGLALLIGSSVMGWLYDLGQFNFIVLLTVATEAVAVVLFVWMARSISNEKNGTDS